VLKLHNARAEYKTDTRNNIVSCKQEYSWLVNTKLKDNVKGKAVPVL